ncbi:MAG: C1 family peptidase [Paenisporosarcina sp.]
MQVLPPQKLSKEDYFPYQDNSPPCRTCQDRDKQVVHIKKHAEILDVDARKKYLSNIGPLIGGLDVYEDFLSYGKGVYSHVTGERRGGHCISVVGYDDKAGCWICKNSWGPDWGDNGFFKMAYGDQDCRMDVRPMWGIYGTK